MKGSLSSVWLKCAHCHRRWHCYSTYACQLSTKCDHQTAQKGDKEWWWHRCQLTIAVSPKVQSRDSVRTLNMCAVWVAGDDCLQQHMNDPCVMAHLIRGFAHSLTVWHEGNTAWAMLQTKVAWADNVVLARNFLVSSSWCTHHSVDAKLCLKSSII